MIGRADLKPPIVGVRPRFAFTVKGTGITAFTDESGVYRLTQCEKFKA